MSKKEAKYKILILGDSKVGKSCFLTRYADNTYESFGDNELTSDYIDRINNLVDLKFKMSKLIISNNFYGKVFGD